MGFKSFPISAGAFGFIVDAWSAYLAFRCRRFRCVSLRFVAGFFVAGLIGSGVAAASPSMALGLASRC
jgi:hypothetical protein